VGKEPSEEIRLKIWDFAQGDVRSMETKGTPVAAEFLK
jgi:hypothetical protein